MVSVARRLEDLARQIKPRKLKGLASPKARLAHEIALLMERLERLRELHRRQLRNLLREECRVGTDLGRTLSFEPRVYFYASDQRLRLKKRLHALGTERRRLSSTHEQDVSELQDRIFRLVWQYLTLGRADA